MKIRDRRTHKRFFVDNAIVDHYAVPLGPIGLAVYIALCRFADKSSQRCWPSYQTLADRIGAGRSTVGDKLKLMKRLGLITWEQQHEGNRLSSNIYTLLDPPKGLVVQQVDYPSPAPDLGVVQQVDSNNPHLEQSSVKLPVPEKAQGTDEGDYFDYVEEPEYVDLEEKETRWHKWQIPESRFQRDFLAVCGAKRFKPKQKTLVKKLAKCLEIGEVLSEAACLQRCLTELRGCTDFPARPIAMPNSWLCWRSDHAQSHRWSVQGLINSLFDRDALVRHCQVMLKKMGAKVSAADEEVPEGMVRVLSEDGVRYINEEEAQRRAA